MRYALMKWKLVIVLLDLIVFVFITKHVYLNGFLVGISVPFIMYNFIFVICILSTKRENKTSVNAADHNFNNLSI